MKILITILCLVSVSFTALAQDQSATMPEEKKEKGWALGLTGGLLTPSGDYGKTYGVTPHFGIRWKTAVGGFFGLFSNIPNLHNDVYISYGLSSFSDEYKEDYKSIFGNEPDDADAGNALTAVNVIRYSFTDMVPLITPYAGAGFGVSYVLGGSLESNLSSLSSFGYGIALKGGAELALTEWFAVDASLDYVIGSYSFMNLGVSAMFLFGGKY